MKTDHQGPGYFEAVPVPPDGHIPGRFVAYRTLDPVRAAALHEAIRAFPNAHFASELDPERAGQILATAKMFEAWLAGPEQYEAWLAGPDA
jgi:hypothetical protein